MDIILHFFNHVVADTESDNFKLQYPNFNVKSDEWERLSSPQGVVMKILKTHSMHEIKNVKML